jgi:hypothetical protein
MFKRVGLLAIKTTPEGMIDLVQLGDFQDKGSAVIRIHPDQVEQALQGLKEAKAELKRSSRT